MNAIYERVPVIIPALNPDDRIITYIRALREQGFSQIVVVDDGSDEAYKQGIFQLIKEENAIVLSYDENQGKGAAIKDGLFYVYNNLHKSIGAVTADYDGRQCASAVALVADELMAGNEFVLGVRDIANSNISKKMRRGYKLTNLVFRLLYSKKVKDIQSGLRGISMKLIPTFLEMKGARYEYEPKMIIEAVREEVPIDEVDVGPILPIDRDETQIVVSEHFRPFKDSFSIVLALAFNFLKYAMTSIIATAIDFAIFYVLSNHVFTTMDLSMCILASTVLARVVSVTVSFMINRNVVFKSKTNLLKNMLMYYGLAAIIMLASAQLVTLFVYLFDGGKTFTKLFVDLCLFFVSYQIQQRVIFKRK